MGENVTTRGLDLLSLPVGTRLHLGAEAVVGVTASQPLRPARPRPARACCQPCSTRPPGQPGSQSWRDGHRAGGR